MMISIHEITVKQLQTLFKTALNECLAGRKIPAL